VDSSPSWYLDAAAAEQKRQVHRELVHRWVKDTTVRTFLKTDLFEEANGRDQILFDLFPKETRAIGMDVTWSTVDRARGRCPHRVANFITCDIRQLALRPASLDLVVSTSTIDHLEGAAEFRASLAEMAGLLRPGGLLVVTVDNPQNPLYRPLRWACRRGCVSFSLGHTVSMPVLNQILSELGMEVVANEWLLHNPRVISTLLFLAIRKLFGKHADRPIQALLQAFASLGRLPTRRFTACFVAACARKPLT
jgi:SAM-dependent methyltransferase